jgi:hypothetical protein
MTARHLSCLIRFGNDKHRGFRDMDMLGAMLGPGNALSLIGVSSLRHTFS